MPRYEYKCSQCDELFEESRSIALRNAPINCSKCGAVAGLVLSIFNTPRGVRRRPGKPSDHVQASKTGRAATAPGGAFLRIGANTRGNVRLWNNRVRGARAGVSISAASKVKVGMRDNRFEDVPRPVEITDD
jgi:putative FmdB family regulatory protein